MAVIPRLADVQCSRLRFESGDRIIVRSFHPLNSEERKKLRRTVERWAGVDVEVLIVDTSQFDVRIEKNRNTHAQQQ